MRHKPLVHRDVACGAEHTVAVASQDVFSWGSNDCGQLGQGDLAPERVLKPKVVKALHGKMVAQVVCGKYHSLAVTMQSHVSASNIAPASYFCD